MKKKGSRDINPADAYRKEQVDVTTKNRCSKVECWKRWYMKRKWKPFHKWWHLFCLHIN